MKIRVLSVSVILLLIQGCGGDKHLPSSNPPEYDPNKVYPSQPEIADRARDISVTDVRPRPATELPITQPVETRNTKPVIQPASTADLVRRILAGGSNGRTALLEAVTASGFAVLDSRKRVVRGIPQKPEMGIPLEDWEVEILARAVSDQMTVPFSELETDIALAVKDERAGHLITAMLLDNIRAGINDPIPTVRTWASLIVELGRQSVAPYDLVTATDFTSVHLNGLQQVLMLKHLSAEFFALGIQRAADRALSHLSAPPRNRPGRLHLVADIGGIPRRVSSFKTGDPCGFGTDGALPHPNPQAAGVGA